MSDLAIKSDPYESEEQKSLSSQFLTSHPPKTRNPDELQELINENRLKEILSRALKDYDLSDHDPLCEDVLKSSVLKCTENILHTLIEISRKRQRWTNISSTQRPIDEEVLRVHPVVASESQDSTKRKDTEVPELRFSLLPATNPKKEMHKIERLAQSIESEKRKTCLAKMRKEEETRGKARRNKVGNPRYEALKEKVERERIEQEALMRTAHTTMAIQHFLSGDMGGRKKKRDLEVGERAFGKGLKRKKSVEKKQLEVNEESVDGEEKVCLRVFRSHAVDKCVEDLNARRKITTKDVMRYMGESPLYKNSRIVRTLSMLNST